jgi:signal transduction histidine kinase
MEFQFTLYSLIYLMAGMITLIPVWTSWRMRKFPGVYFLVWMMFFMSLWTFLCAFEMTVVELGFKRAVLVLEDATFLTFSGMLCFFILDYFSIGRRLVPTMRRWMGVFLGILVFLDMTDSWHGLIYKSFRAGPPGSNLLFFSYGPLYYSVTTLLYVVDLTLLVIVGYFAFQKSGRLHIQARFIFAGIFSYCLSNILYVLIPDQSLGLSILPIGFAVCGMLISWAVFEDLLGHFQAQAGDLQASRDNLAARLSDQQQKVSGMYDLVYLNTSQKDSENLIQEALEKMRLTNGSDAAVFFLCLGNQCVLEVESGLNENQKQALAAWKIPEMDGALQVTTWSGTPHWPAIPEQLLPAGFQSAAAKSISLSAGQQGYIFYLWQESHSFQVDDTALMDAQVDVLSMIIENDHSRRLAQEWAALEERQRLGRELHDRISQDLFSLSIFGASSIHHAAAGLSADLDDDLNTINNLAQQALNEMRLLLFELQPHNQINDIPLEEAIQKRFAIVESHVNIQTSLVVSRCEALPKPIARVIYGVVVESLNNTVKYAKAKMISIFIQVKGQHVCLEIRDNGVGFDSNTGSRRGLGLENMRQRVEQINGKFQIESEIGKGTFISAVIPISNKASAALPISEPNPTKRGSL